MTDPDIETVRTLKAIALGWYEPAPPWAMQENYGKKRLSRRAMMRLASEALPTPPQEGT